MSSPPAQPLVGHLQDLRRDPLGFTTLCAQYGDVVPLRAGPNRILMLNNPEDIHDVLVTRNQLFRKGYATRGLVPMTGYGLVTSDGDLWRRQRRLVQPGFHRRRVAAHAAHMVDELDAVRRRWRDGEERDLHADMLAVTLEIVTTALFGPDVRERIPAVHEALTTVLTTLNYRLSTLLFLVPGWVPLPAYRRLRAGMRTLDELVYGVIAERQRSGERRDDLLGLMMDVEDEDGTRMSLQQLRDEVMTLMVAGHETTALVLSWSWYLLAQHPEAEARLLAEVDERLGSRAPTMQDLPELEYADAVVKESMRLYPPGWVIFREALEDLEIRGHRVRRGETVSLPQWAMHRSERWYPEAERFRPERWLGGWEPPKLAYFPFGGGPRLCMGSHFATVEATLLLAAMAQRHRFSLAPGHEVVPEPAITLRPRTGIRVIIHERPGRS